MPEKHIFHNIKSVSKLYMAYDTPNGTCTFPHSYTASFLQKLILCETNYIFYSQGNCIWHKMNDILWKYIKNKSEVTLDSFPDFAYVSSYLRLNIFTWKRDYVISQELQMPPSSLRQF